MILNSEKYCISVGFQRIWPKYVARGGNERRQELTLLDFVIVFYSLIDSKGYTTDE